MVFSSTIFIYIYLPITLFLYYLLPTRYNNYILLVASILFYAWGEPIFVLVMLVSIYINFYLAKILDQSRDNRKRLVLTLSIVLNLGILIIFKYLNFIIDNINLAFNISISIPQIRLPIGISFFTFQAMSYVIDTYRGLTSPRHKITNTALYISFFPQLIAGPIVKYHDISEQITSRIHSPEVMARGLKRFIVGLSKKLLIANMIGKIADRIFGMNPQLLNTPTAWFGAITYTLQIYFDFSGYSDMAIGLAQLFGFKIKENFNYPFIATSIKDFWRRWHISLSTWFKEYLYIPLGGNKRGIKRTCLNIAIVFLCTGFWHGAEWTFLVWGVFHGFFLILENLNIIPPKFLKTKFLSNLYTLLVVIVGFTIFRAENLAKAFYILKNMFNIFDSNLELVSNIRAMLSPTIILTYLIAVIASTPIVKLLQGFLLKTKLARTSSVPASLITFILFLLCILSLSNSAYNPFIYFRF